MLRSKRSRVVMPSELINVEHPFYNSPSVHKGMLDDEVRTLSFKRALEKTIKPNSIVLDIGTGTGILAAFAVRCGAQKVYALESSDEIFDAAKDMFKRNKLNTKIKLVRYRKGQKLDIPKNIDIIVSECLGHFAFDENMISAVSSYKKFLRPDGIFIPSQISLFLSPVFAPEVYNYYVTTWENPIYGFDFSNMRSRALNRIYVATVDPNNFLAKPINILDYTLGSSAEVLDGKGSFEITQHGVLHGFVGFFETMLAEGVILSTSPINPITHWEQVILPVDCIEVKKGDIINVKLGIQSFRNSNRVKFKWSIFGKTVKTQTIEAII